MLGMRARLSIGDFRRMTHLSVKALRHYHDLGLLVAAEVDPATGYRHHEPSQVPLAQAIRGFRELGMPLEEIRAVLSALGLASRNELIAAHARRTETQVARESSRGFWATPPPTLATSSSCW
jgi:DNA-binding transcriptional MerR regulator